MIFVRIPSQAELVRTDSTDSHCINKVSRSMRSSVRVYLVLNIINFQIETPRSTGAR